MYDIKKGEKADVDFYIILVWGWIFLPFIVLGCLVIHIEEKLKVFYLKIFESKKES